MKRVSIQRHAEWQMQFAAKQAFINEPVAIHGLLDDDDIDELLVTDPFNGDPPSKRKDSELARVLSILDSLEQRGTHEG